MQLERINCHATRVHRYAHRVEQKTLYTTAGEPEIKTRVTCTITARKTTTRPGNGRKTRNTRRRDGPCALFAKFHGNRCFFYFPPHSPRDRSGVSRNGRETPRSYNRQHPLSTRKSFSHIFFGTHLNTHSRHVSLVYIGFTRSLMVSRNRFVYVLILIRICLLLSLPLQ